MIIKKMCVGRLETEDKNMEAKDKNELEEVKTKRAHRGQFCSKYDNTTTNSRKLECPRIPRILIHPWKDRDLVLKTTKHTTKERKEGLSSGK